MVPLVGAEVENETKDSLYLRCEVGCFDVAESEFVWLLKTHDMARRSVNLLKSRLHNEDENLRRSSLNLVVKLVWATR